MTHQIRTAITSTTRARNDNGGNPRYSVTTTDGVWNTAEGGQVGYGIATSEYQGEVVLTVRTTSSSASPAGRQS